MHVPAISTPFFSLPLAQIQLGIWGRSELSIGSRGGALAVNELLRHLEHRKRVWQQLLRYFPSAEKLNF